MRVFVTGATGFIGSAVVQELIKAGHQVLGLARSDASAQALVTAGAEVLHGDLQDLDSLRSGAAVTDGIIHCGFIHDFSRFKEICEIDRAAITAMGGELKATNKPIIVCSGVLLLEPGRLNTEMDTVNFDSNAFPRVASEEAVQALLSQGVRGMVVRLSPTVHGKGDHGFIPYIIETARQTGVSAYIGDGQNHWPAIHRLDAATLFRLALEKGLAGDVFHGVTEQGVPIRKVAEVIGKHLNLPVVSKSTEEAATHFTWMAHFLATDCLASSEITKQKLGWQPEHPGLIADLDNDYYFEKHN